jgi:hypothetical protein
MKIQLSQKEVSQLIANYLYRQKIVKSEYITVQYIIAGSDDELTVYVEEK